MNNANLDTLIAELRAKTSYLVQQDLTTGFNTYAVNHDLKRALDALELVREQRFRLLLETTRTSHEIQKYTASLDDEIAKRLRGEG